MLLKLTLTFLSVSSSSFIPSQTKTTSQSSSGLSNHAPVCEINKELVALIIKFLKKVSEPI